MSRCVTLCHCVARQLLPDREEGSYLCTSNADDGYPLCVSSVLFVNLMHTVWQYCDKMKIPVKKTIFNMFWDISESQMLH